MVFLMIDFSFFCDVFENNFWHLMSHGVAGDGAELGFLFVHICFCGVVHLCIFTANRGSLNHLILL